MRQAQKLPNLSTIKIADRYKISFNDEAKRVTLSGADQVLITHEQKQLKVVAKDLSLPYLQEIEVILQQKLKEISTPQSQKASLNKQGKGVERD
jgi:hypothetical protein